MSWEGDCENAKNWYLNKDMNYHINKENNMNDKKYFSAEEAREISDAINSDKIKR